MALHGPILAVVDFAAGTEEVLRQAQAIAAGMGVPLVVGHVLPERLTVRMLFPQFAGEDRATLGVLEERARAAIAERVPAVTGRAPDAFDVELETGSPHAGVLQIVDRVSAGLLVMGPGGTTDRVARFAPCPLLVARPSAKGSVLAATDFSDPSLPAVAAAADEARRRHAPLRLITCLESAEPITLGSVYLGVLPELPSRLIAELREDARTRLQAIGAGLSVPTQCSVVEGRAADAIVRAATDMPTELLVIGIRGRSNLSRLFLGSVAESIVHSAPCAVLLVHTHHPAHPAHPARAATAPRG